MWWVMNTDNNLDIGSDSSSADDLSFCRARILAVFRNALVSSSLHPPSFLLNLCENSWYVFVSKAARFFEDDKKQGFLS